MTRDAVETTQDEHPTDDRKFGSGWMSGTISVFLSTAGLLGVLCFHFPELLTIPELRGNYPVPVMRGLLHVILVAGFLLGLLSVMLRRSKWLGLSGMGIVLVAALLGGSRVPLEKDIRLDFYFGMDYFLLILIFYSLIFIPLEKLFGRLRQEVFRFGWKVDLMYFFVGTLLVQLTTYLTLKPAVVLFNWAIDPDVQAWVQSQPGWLQFLEIMFLADLVQYWVHRLFHQISWMWPFHAVHHSAQVMDWLAGNRMHIVELTLTRSTIFMPAFILGFNELPMIAYIIFVSLHSVFLHANLRFDFGKFCWLIATPQYHHWHHALEEEGIDKNFAIHFPVLDMVFGTYYLPAGVWPKGYGVLHGNVPESYFAQWVYPFRKKK